MSPVETFAERWYAAPREAVFRAFTEPHLLEQWFCPSPEVAMRVERCEVRVGGAYRFVYYFPGGRTIPVVGEYRTVDPPERLEFTWTWEPPDPWAGIETLVTVSLAARGGGTQVNVRHERLTQGEMKSMHESGWAGALVQLDKLLMEPGEAG